MITHGEIPFPYQLQPERTIAERNDGTLEGQVEFICDATLTGFLPIEDDPHPDDLRLELHTRELTYLRNGRVRMIGSYLGLRDDPTDKIISYIGNPDRERIETHPNWAEIGGTPSSPLNGALFIDPSSGALSTDDALGFFDSFSNVTSDFYGVSHYLKTSTQITLTWWQTKVPDLSRRGKIVDNVKPFKKPADVTNFLIVDIPYRQIGSHYQVSEILLGSGGDGWNETVYPQD